MKFIIVDKVTPSSEKVYYSQQRVYDRSAQLEIESYAGDGSLYLTDLTDALKPGKECTRFRIAQSTDRNYPEYQARNLLSILVSAKFLFDLLMKMNWVREERPLKNWETVLPYEPIEYTFQGVNLVISRTTVESKRQFSPFASLKPLKKVPKKFTLTHFRKMVFNGQYTGSRCTGVYTDDYAYDAATNYSQGEIGLGGLAYRIIDSPSGWWVSSEAHGEKNEYSICCHNFDNNRFVLDLDGKVDPWAAFTDPWDYKNDERQEAGKFFHHSYAKFISQGE